MQADTHSLGFFRFWHPENSITFGSAPRREAESQPISQLVRQATSQTVRRASRQAETHTVRFLGFWPFRPENSITFGSAPRREADNKPISQLVKQAISQTASQASRQAETHSLGFFTIWPFRPENSTTFGSTPRREADNKPISQLVKQAISQTASQASMQADTHSLGFFRFWHPENSITFGSAPRREADSQPISQLVRQATSQTVRRASRQAETHTVRFLGFWPFRPENSITFGSAPRREADNKPISQLVKQAISQTVSRASMQADTHSLGFFRFWHPENSITFGSAPRREADSQPISQLVRQAISQTVRGARRQADTHSLGFFRFWPFSPESSITFGSAPRREADSQPISQFVKQAISQTVSWASRQAETHTVRFLGFWPFRPENSITFGSAPRREADNKPISQLVKQAISQTASQASRQAETHSLGFFTIWPFRPENSITFGSAPQREADRPLSRETGYLFFLEGWVKSLCSQVCAQRGLNEGQNE